MIAYDMDMTESLILKIAVAAKFWEGLDYLPPPNLTRAQLVAGMRLMVPLGRRQVVGVLLSVQTQTSIPHDKMRAAIEVLDDTPLLSQPLIQLLQWVSDYYHYPIGETIMTALPKGLRQGKPATVIPVEHAVTNHRRRIVIGHALVARPFLDE